VRAAATGSVHQRRLCQDLIAAGNRISVDSRGRWIDNLFIERDRPLLSSRSGSCWHAPGSFVSSGWSVPLVSPLAAQTMPACRRLSFTVLLRKGRPVVADSGAPASFDVAWSSPRFWSWERIDTPESGAFDEVKRPFRTCRKNAARFVSAARSTWASATRPWRRLTGQTSRPEPPRSASEPFRLQRKTESPRPLDRRVNDDSTPKHGCRGYSSSRNSVPSVFSSFVV
jgi:hypothetical protein